MWTKILVCLKQFIPYILLWACHFIVIQLLVSYATIIWLSTICFDPFETSSDGLWFVSITPLVHVHVYCVLAHGYFWFNIIGFFGLIQLCDCALNWFTVKLVHKGLLDICHLCGLGQHIINMFLSGSYVQMILNWFEKKCMTLKTNIS
jgi:hypothetical protein